MSRICPVTGEKVVYLVCQECEDKADCSRGKIKKNKGENHEGNQDGKHKDR